MPAPTTAGAPIAPPSGAPGSVPGASQRPSNPPALTPAGPILDQPWATPTLIDVSTRQEFRIADLAAAGQVVFIETMAIWCANCRAQQREAVSAFAQLDPSRVVWLGLDVETSETPEALARYREQNGFPFRYAIADRELSRALAGQFGDVVLSPPSVNLIIVGQDGRISHLLGHHGASELIALAAEHGV